MRKKFFSKRGVMLFTTILLFSVGCLKDKVNYTYRMYLPVYQSLTAVRAGMKTKAAASFENIGKIYIQGNYIYLNELEKGIHIIDNSNPSHPVNAGFISIPGNEDMAIKDATLYADAYSDLVAFDINDPLHAQTKKILPNVFPERNYYYYGPTANPDSIKVIVDWTIKDTTVNYDTYRNYYLMSSGAPYASSLSNVTAVSGRGGSKSRFTVVNGYLYTVSYSDLNVFTLGNGNQPVFAKKSQLGSNIETIYPLKDKLFIGSNLGIYMFDLAFSPESPHLIGQFTHARACDPVIADDNYAYVTLNNQGSCKGTSNELDIVDIKNLTNPQLKTTYPLTLPEGLSKDKNTLFICDGKGGLKVFDAADINQIHLIKQLNETEPIDVIADNGLALVVGRDGLFEYDYSDLNNIHLSSNLAFHKN